MEQRKNQKGNWKILRNELKWKHNKPKLMDWVKVVLREIFIAINGYIKKKEGSQINSLAVNLKTLGKVDQNKLQRDRKNEMIKIGVETNERENEE